MNQDEKFQQIWEFRRGDDDRDSSDDSKMMNPSEELGGKPSLDLVLCENDEETETATCQKPADTNNGAKTVKPAKRKTRAKPDKTKKNNLAKTKAKAKTKTKSSPAKKKKVMRNRGFNQARMFEDLKIFAGSVIDDLKVARENMFAQMKEELMAFRPREMRVMKANMKKPPPQNGTESYLNPQTHSEELMEKGMRSVVGPDVHNSSKAVEVAAKHDQVTQLLMSNKQAWGKLLPNRHMNMEANNSDDQVYQVFSLPPGLPDPRAQGSRNGIPLDGGGPAVAPDDKAAGLNMKRLDPRMYYQGFPVIQQELFQSFPHITSKGVGSVDQNSSHYSSMSVGFPAPAHQGLDIESSMEGGSNITSHTYSDAAFQNHSRAGLMMNARFPGGSAISSEDVSPSNVLQRNGGGFVRSQSQVMKDGHMYSNLRNKQ